MQCPLYEWGNNRTPMGRSAPDVINRIGSLRGVCDLLQTLGVDGLAAGGLLPRSPGPRSAPPHRGRS